MILYHVTNNINEPKIKEFIPRVSDNTGPQEDDKIRRICLSDSIETCIQAMPRLTKALITGNTIRVYQCNTDDLDKTKLVYPLTIFFEKLVPDALENHEYWYIGKLNMKSKLYKILNFDYEFDIAWTCINTDDIIRITSHIIGSNVDIEYNKYDAFECYDNIIEKYKYIGSEIEDGLWDELAMLPWAKLIKVNNIKLLEIEEN